MEYNYYLHVFDSKDVIYRISKEGRINKNIDSLEVFLENRWSVNLEARKTFMNHYVTGWIDEEDAIQDFNIASTKLFEKKYLTIKDFAINIHKNQSYGVYKYEVHLINVLGVLLRHNVNLSKENYPLLASAWLHDVLEDTIITKDEFVNRFGQQIYDIVWALTDGDGNHRIERKDKMYEKLIHNQDAIIVKLADRISNIEFSLINLDLEHLNKYKFENIELNKRLKNHIHTDLGNRLFKYLNCLVYPR